ncbi:unnamed protein product [Psylliodes chrysocephalus]|uniref:Uncharacterized protein n=1 Tax=Psylliodes chrysocephalus TaxID=3402493 RepID=A0A9P0GA21_9CUCU|nr:unnamed protein product [Psylliodes chrysocephala]
MLNKAVVVFLTCLAFTLAAPATEDRTTTVVRSQGHDDVQRLIEELERGHAPNKKDTVVKKTTITTIEEPAEETLSDDEQLREFMKDPKFVKELEEFLMEFLKMYNSLNKMQRGSSTSSKVISEENSDVQSLLRNPSFFSFLSSFFNNNNQQGGLSGFFAQLFDQNKRPATSISEEYVNGHSRPVVVEHPTPQVTITHLETSDLDSQVPVSSGSGASVAEAVLDKLTGSSSSSRPHKTTTTTVIEESSSSDEENSGVADRFGGNSHVTITHVGNDGHENIFHENNVVSTSEELLNQLKHQNSYEPASHTVERHDSIVHPTVIVHKVPTTSSSHSDDWSEVHPSNHVENSAEFQQQAKNANYQYASQVDDHINGNYQQKAEVRQGGVVYGKYSYDDGFFWRTVYYQADKNGYVVTR